MSLRRPDVDLDTISAPRILLDPEAFQEISATVEYFQTCSMV